MELFPSEKVCYNDILYIYDVINCFTPYQIGEFIKNFDKNIRPGKMNLDLYNHSPNFSVFRRQYKIYPDLNCQIKNLPRCEFISELKNYFMNDQSDLTLTRLSINNGTYVQRRFERTITFRIKIKTGKKKIASKTFGVKKN